jgi:hypothetical protein
MVVRFHHPPLHLLNNIMNTVLSTHLSYGESGRILLKAKYALLQEALTKASLDPNRYSALKPECYTNLVVIENRKCEWIDYYLHALALGADMNTVFDVNDCESNYSNVNIP